MPDEERWMAIGADPSGKFVFKEVTNEEIDDMWGADDNITYMNRELFEKLKAAIEGRTLEPKFQVICYMRVEPEDAEPMSYDEAQAELANLTLMQPENEYRIEQVKCE